MFRLETTSPSSMRPISSRHARPRVTGEADADFGNPTRGLTSLSCRGRRTCCLQQMLRMAFVFATRDVSSRSRTLIKGSISLERRRRPACHWPGHAWLFILSHRGINHDPETRRAVRTERGAGVVLRKRWRTLVLRRWSVQRVSRRLRLMVSNPASESGRIQKVSLSIWYRNRTSRPEGPV